MSNQRTQKWKKRSLTVLSAALCASLSLGVLAACKTTPDDSSTDPSPVAPADTQLLKNGNFEFYGDNNLTELRDKHGLINSPTSWSFTSGSPSSNAASGIINLSEWNNYSQSGGYQFATFNKGEGDNQKEVTTFQSIEEAVQHWEDSNVSAYDRVKFLDVFEDEIEDLDANSESAKLFKKYAYNVDFDDLKNLNEDLPGGISARPGAKEGENSVLMIHNEKDSDGVRGTAQYYTSSTTVSLSAGTSAKVSVWLKTEKLYHYENTELNARGGAYIGVINSVGGTTLDQMQVYNVNTHGEWKQYTFYIRANTFASSTFRIVLGLGQGSSDDRYYAVDGYAFFDDVTCEKMPSSEFESLVFQENSSAPNEGIKLCTIDSLKEEKRFDADSVTETVFALDLYAGFDSDLEILKDAVIGLSEEKSGSKTYTSASIDSSLGDDQSVNYTKISKIRDLANSENVYVRNVYENDFKEKFPFGDEDSEVLLLLSANGAAYSATLSSPQFTLAPDTRKLISFFVKTSKVPTGLMGASAFILDGENKTAISAFDSTTLTTVDIDDEHKDIYKGWAQCFFFLENDTEEEKTFTLRLSLGPTNIIGTNQFSYGDGYAAFANFETRNLTKTQYGYVSTSDRAQKVSLTGGVEETKKFDSVSVTDEETIKERPALPTSFYGVSGGSRAIVADGEANKLPRELDVTAGLLSHKYAETYFRSEESWKNTFGSTADNAEAWWTEIFDNARQPLVIVNGEQEASYGFLASSSTSVSASSYQRVSMRVKASVNAKAYIYIMETSAANSGKGLSVPLPGFTYWYDASGNICASDPADKDFDESTGILYELQPNGLYRKVNESAEIYYANFSGYQSDSEGNLTTRDEEIVFYFHDGVYYAYREENEDGDFTYSTPVSNLPGDIARYQYNGRTAQEAVIVVEGTGDWVNVNFNLHTGDEEKSFRVEVWSGDRTGETLNPKGSYVIFDNYISENSSSTYSNLLNASLQSIRDELNEGKTMEDEEYLGANDRLPESYRNATYYTYTFFDSDKYVRYDETTDADEKGNPWHNYSQSNYSEMIVSLYHADKEGDQVVAQNFFLDFGATDITIAADYPNVSETDNSETEETPAAETNIWLLISSGVLAVILILVIVLVLFRSVFTKKKHTARIKSSKKQTN